MHAHPLATLPAPAHLPPAGEGARRADEGASAASCFWVSPGKQIKSTLRCARAPSSGASRHLLPQAGEGLRSGLIPSGASRTAYGEESSTFAAPTGLRGSVPPDSVLVVRSQATVCRLPHTWLERRLLPSSSPGTSTGGTEGHTSE